MQGRGCVAGDALEGLEQLVHDVLLVHVLQDIGANDVVQIGVHVSERIEDSV